MNSFEVGDIVKIRDSLIYQSHTLFQKPLTIIEVGRERLTVKYNSADRLTLRKEKFELLKKLDDNVFYKWLMYNE